jgi:glycosyltransferase involved in cell wall biosynthesis
MLGDRLKVIFMSATAPNRKWTVPYGTIRFKYEILRGVNTSLVPRNSFARYWNLGLGNALREFAPTVVVVGGYYHPTSFLAAWHAKRLKAALYLWCESTLYDKRSGLRVVEFIKRRYLFRCDGFIVPGTASQQYLQAYGIGADRITVAPNAVDSDVFLAASEKFRTEEIRRKFRAEHGLPEVLLLFVGRLSPEKGFPVVLEVAALLAAGGQEVGVLVVGDGPHRAQYEKMVASRSLRNILFLGFKQQRELPFYYSQGDILLVPSISEPWGLVVNEAMTCGVPVLCSPRVGAALDLVMDGRTGYRCHGPGEFARRVQELIICQSLLEKMSEECQRVALLFSPLACAQGFLNILARECEGKSPFGQCV